MKNQIETREKHINEVERLKIEQNKTMKNLREINDKVNNTIEKQEDSTPGWQETFDSALDIIALISADFEILKINKAGYKNLGMNPEELVGKKCYEVVHGLQSPIEGCPCVKVLKTESSGIGEVRDHGRIYTATASPVLDKNKEIIAFAHTIKDITEQKRTEDELRHTQEVLEKKVLERTEDLDRKNIALQEIIDQIEIDRKRTKLDVKVNIERIIFPTLEKLKKEKNGKKYADLLMHHLSDLTSSYGITLTNGSIKLTQREIEICSMIKATFTNKEIAKLLSISSQTVEWHRKRIRHKLGIVNKGINLSTYLHEL